MTKNNILNFNTLLELYGFSVPREKKTKLVFHTTSEYNLLQYFRRGKIDAIEAYQSEQGKDVFKNCENIISFLKNGPRCALFIGIYRIENCRKLDDPPPEFLNCPEGQKWRPGSYWYDMIRLDCMSEMMGRLVVDWGTASLSWHQWLLNEYPKKVIEIYPRPLQLEFPGFDDLLLSYSELSKVIKDQETYREWHDKLKSVAGVYLITDTTNGLHYVGSAYGDDGLFRRWSDYVESGHGGNKGLLGYSDFSVFQFSILYTCPILKSKDDDAKAKILHYESLFKEKLKSRKYHLNKN